MMTSPLNELSRRPPTSTLVATVCILAVSVGAAKADLTVYGRFHDDRWHGDYRHNSYWWDLPVPSPPLILLLGRSIRSSATFPGLPSPDTPSLHQARKYSSPTTVLYSIKRDGGTRSPELPAQSRHVVCGSQRLAKQSRFMSTRPYGRLHPPSASPKANR